MDVEIYKELMLRTIEKEIKKKKWKNSANCGFHYSHNWFHKE